MSNEKIIQFNEEVVKGEIRDLVRTSIEETLSIICNYYSIP